jgi:hypothetical protein
MDNAGSLVRWNVPFAEARDPSVSVITEHGGDVVILSVAPGGVDQYPKYLVRFARVIALLYYEEALAFDRGYRALPGLDADVHAYEWLDSPWIHGYRRGAETFGWPTLQHFVIFGGDSIVEIIASGGATVDQIDAPMKIETTHEA